MNETSVFVMTALLLLAAMLVICIIIARLDRLEMGIDKKVKTAALVKLGGVQDENAKIEILYHDKMADGGEMRVYSLFVGKVGYIVTARVYGKEKIFVEVGTRYE